MNPQAHQTTQLLTDSKSVAVTTLITSMLATITGLLSPVAIFMLIFNDTGNDTVQLICSILFGVITISLLAQPILLMVLAKTGRRKTLLNGWSFWIGVILLSVVLICLALFAVASIGSALQPQGTSGGTGFGFATFSTLALYTIVLNVLPMIGLTSVVLGYILSIKEIRSR